jgi:hypothetical protein
MDKTDIKYILRESLVALSEDKEKKDSEDKKDSEKENEEKVEYNDIVNFFKKHATIKQVGVFREAGFSEDEIYQRLPYKKLNKEKNDMGGNYSFNKEEVDRIRTVLSKYPGGGKAK